MVHMAVLNMNEIEDDIDIFSLEVDYEDDGSNNSDALSFEDSKTDFALNLDDPRRGGIEISELAEGRQEKRSRTSTSTGGDDDDDDSSPPSSRNRQQDRHQDSRHVHVGNDGEQADVDLDQILAREFSSLTVAEREDVLFGIHGVVEPTPEPPAQELNKLLAEMDVRLKYLSLQTEVQGATAYQKAVLQNSEYVTSRTFRLGFLRSEQVSSVGEAGEGMPPLLGGSPRFFLFFCHMYHTVSIDVNMELPPAALLIFIYFISHHRMKYDVKAAADRLLRHFHYKHRIFDSLLGRQVLIEDFNSETIACLESGLGQVLPLCDRAGRPVFLWSTRHRHGASLESMVSRKSTWA